MENPKFNTDYLFRPGKLTFLIDTFAGSSGKGKLAAFIGKHSTKMNFAVVTFSSNASHWVRDKERGEWCIKHVSSAAPYIHDESNDFDTIYIGHGSAIDLDALNKEIEIFKLTPQNLRIDPLASIITDADIQYEMGTADFRGNLLSEEHEGTIKTGSTCSGSGAARAHKIMRRNTLFAKEIEELQKYIAPVGQEVMARLNEGESGLFEIAQGFQLSYALDEFAPYTTGRNCSVAAGLDDSMISPAYAGPVILNCRSFPIRIHSKKYRSLHDGFTYLTWDEIKPLKEGVDYEVVQSFSGDWWPDQTELTWEQITKMSGSPKPIMEQTSLTKLPRRIATFSQEGLIKAITHNWTGESVYLCLAFADYIDYRIAGKKYNESLSSGINDVEEAGAMPEVVQDWLAENISPVIDHMWRENPNIDLNMPFISTGAQTDDMIQAPHWASEFLC